MIIQYGDYGEAYSRFQKGGDATFRDQRHSVEFVESLSAEHDVVVVCASGREHEESLKVGLSSIGLPKDAFWKPALLWPLLDRLQPQALICRTPSRVAFVWAARNGIAILPDFADMFTNRTLRDRWRNWRLGRLLRQCQAPCVANHSLTASQSVRLLGIPATRIVPHEYLRLSAVTPPKQAPPITGPLRVFFAGQLIESKGVGDCIDAVAVARSKGLQVELTLAGSGDVAAWESYARDRHVSDSVRLLGSIAAERVLKEMREHDAVVVASRHSYAEGLPNTIFEAFASRTPLIASDHPAYVNRLQSGIDSLRFRAGDPADLAQQWQTLSTKPELYATLSSNSEAALPKLYVGVEWSKLIKAFIDDPTNATGWVEPLSLKAIGLAD
ncbi:MAG: glycosyltransferase family 4 protein [Planctomycetales bacterium]|nr:glycosyltransferase family 4 protein [Planctomycetales bacterium]